MVGTICQVAGIMLLVAETTRQVAETAYLVEGTICQVAGIISRVAGIIFQVAGIVCWVVGTATGELISQLADLMIALSAAVQDIGRGIVLLVMVSAVVVADSLHIPSLVEVEVGVGVEVVVAIALEETDMMIILMGDAMEEIGSALIAETTGMAVIVTTMTGTSLVVIALEGIDIWTGTLKMGTTARIRVTIGKEDPEVVATSMEVEEGQPVSTGEATGTDPVLMIALEKQVDHLPMTGTEMLRC